MRLTQGNRRQAGSLSAHYLETMEMELKEAEILNAAVSQVIKDEGFTLPTLLTLPKSGDLTTKLADWDDFTC